MIITKIKPYTKEEIAVLSEEYEIYIKTVIDVRQRICSAGANMHADSEKILVSQGSLQENIWGGGVNLETLEIDYNSFINIRMSQNNKSSEIQDSSIREKYDSLTRYFFRILYER